MGTRAAFFALMVAAACGGGAKKPAGPTNTDSTAVAKPPTTPTPPPKPQPQPVDVTTLEVWAGNVDGGPVAVTAADVDGEVLRRVVVPAAIEIITVRSDGLVTGRVTGSRVGVLSALTGVSPALKLGPRAKLTGKGPAMAIDEVGIDVRELFPMFAEALKTNVVVIAPPQKLTVSANAPSAQKLMDEVAKAAGLVIEKPAANVTVVRAKSQPKIGKVAAKGPKIDLDVRGARPGDVLGLIRALTGADPATEPCTPGETTTFRLKAVASGAAEKLVEKLGGDAKVTACAPAPDAKPDQGKVTLVASATSGGKTLWLAMGDGRALILDGGSWPTATDATASGADGDPLADARLAATIAGIGKGVAIVEVDGEFRVLEPVDDGAGLVTVGLGEVELADAQGTKRTLKLAKRPP